MATDSPTHELSQTVQEISERAALLVHEEIELAKAEITEKITKLLKGIAVGLCAGVFVITGVLYMLHGFAWLAWDVLPVRSGAVWWGFFIVAGTLFLLGGLAGYLAARFLKEGQPPTPNMAIDEAKKIKGTLKFKRKAR